MKTQEMYYQPLPPHWADHVRDAYYSVNWPMPNKMDFAGLVAVGAIIVAVALAIIVNQ